MELCQLELNLAKSYALIPCNIWLDPAMVESEPTRTQPSFKRIEEAFLSVSFHPNFVGPTI